MHAYETKIDKLERLKIVLQVRLDKTLPPKGQLEHYSEPLLYSRQALGIYAKMATM
jgi:hypothetical protein